MAYPVTFKRLRCILAISLVCVSSFCCNLGKAYEDLPEAGEGIPQTGVVGGDPAHIVAKALLCFHDKYIYSSCEESHRLTESGELHVPPEYVDEYCNGPCLAETHLVLNCVENTLKHFIFYNRATIRDIRETIKAGCSYGLERGNFNVEEHLEDENNAHKTAYNILFGLGLMITAHGFLVG